jgi:hypothetical protein
MWNVINNTHARTHAHKYRYTENERTLRVDLKHSAYHFFSQDSDWPEVRVNETIRMSCLACIKYRGERIPRLKGLRFRDCSQYEIARHRERDMRREAARPQVYALGRSGGELPWPPKRIVALAKRVTLTVPRGGILHGTHFEEGQMDERWKTRLRAESFARSCLDFSRIFHIRTASLTLSQFLARYSRSRCLICSSRRTS